MAVNVGDRDIERLEAENAPMYVPLCVVEAGPTRGAARQQGPTVGRSGVSRA